MIILDTNVISSFIHSQPDPISKSWLDKIEPHTVWITTISVLEIQYGINLLPEGKKKAQLDMAFSKMLDEKYRSRVLEFDVTAAKTTADIAASHKQSGRNIAIQDSMIAGIARSNDAFLATRNVRDFIGTGVEIINPWEQY